MRGKFRAIWRVSFALVVALSVGLVMTPGGEVSAATEDFTTPGTFNWTVPAGVTQITVEAWGAGGAGGGSNNYTSCKGAGGAGGGGGAYAANSTVSVTPGQNLTIVVGAGGIGVYGADGNDGGHSFVGNDTNPAHAFVLAAGGSGGTANIAGGQPPGGAGGRAEDSVGQTRIAGGNGTDGDSGGLVYSGDGGDGAYGGGSGGDGFDGAENKNGYPGKAPGGGGGGGRTSNDYGGAHAGGDGGDGKVVITYEAHLTYTLTITSTTCCTVTTPGEGTSSRNESEVVNLVATPDAGCWFVYWSATAGTFANPNAATTTFTMPGKNATVTAHCEAVPVTCYKLCIYSSAGGSVTTPGEGTYSYNYGTVVNIVATPDTGYQFVNWTYTTGAPIANTTAPSTNITMNAHYSIQANFEEITGYSLTISSTTGGNVTTPGEGTFIYDVDEVVNLVATPASGYQFDNWTGNVTAIANVNAASTTITMNGNYGITANFEVAPPEVPTVTTQAATTITTDSATMNMNYTVGNSSSVEVCFAYKKSTDSAWSSTDWVSKSADGNYAKSLTGLDSDTEYEFKAQLKYDSTVIEGTTRQFTTEATSAPEPSGGYCFIATAAYGNPAAEQIDVLREFRDVVLLESTVGSQFVSLYYQLSPPVADFIARSDTLRTLVREFLVDPVVWIVETTGAIWRN
jgi:hypothetical protein